MKKKVGILIIAILAVLTLVGTLLPTLVLADGAGLLSIDNVNKYAGMSKTYSEGYTPAGANGSMKIIVPLVENAGASIQGSTITVTPGLGAPGSSPFVFGNYIKTIKRAPCPINDGTVSKDAYLIDLTLPLASDRTRGTYPITLDVTYKDGGGTDMQQSFPLYVSVDGKNPEGGGQPKPEGPRHQPKVLVTDYGTNPDVVAAGQEYQLKFTVKNTSTSYTLYNIKISIKGSSGDLRPVDNTNTLYYKSLGKGKSMDISFPMKASADIKTEPHSVTVTIEYEDNKASGFSASEEIPISVSQPMRVEFDKPNVPQSMSAGDTAPFTMQVINKGKGMVYNVTCKLEAPGLMPRESAFLGNMEAGTAKSAQMTVFAGTKDMTVSSDGNVTTSGEDAEKYGMTFGSITITYEDEFGKQYSDKVDIQTNIKPPEIPASAPQTEEKPKASQWWVSVLIAAAIIAAIAATLILLRKNRKKKVGADEIQ